MSPLEAAIERYRTCNYLPGDIPQDRRMRDSKSDQRLRDSELIADAYIDQLEAKQKEEAELKFVVEAIDSRGDIDVVDDGEFVLWSPRGYLRADQLRVIASELDRRNADQQHAETE